MRGKYRISAEGFFRFPAEADHVSTDYDYWLLLPWPVRKLPADLAAAIVFATLACLAVVLPGVRETPLRLVLGLPFLLFFPGYVLVAAIFPRAERRGRRDSLDRDASADGPGATSADGTANGVEDAVANPRPWPETGLDGLERVVFSVGASLAVVPLVGYLLNFTPWGIAPVPALLVVAAFTVVTAGVAAARRWNVPADARFRVPYERWYASAQLGFFDRRSKRDAILGVLLAATVLLATASIAYAVTVPTQEDSFTEFYLLTENGSDELVADDFPRELTVGQDESVHLGIENHEGTPTDYTVIAALQRVEVRNDSTRVLEQRELRRVNASVSVGETWTRELSVTPTLEGERLRLVFLLYDGEPASQPTVENADQRLYLWVNVTDSETADSELRGG